MTMRGRCVWYVPEDSHIDGEGFRVSLVFEDEDAHFPTGTWPYTGAVGEKRPWFVRASSHEEAKRIVAEINTENGDDEKAVAIIVGRSMVRGLPADDESAVTLKGLLEGHEG